jgi:hypothetical protein
LPKEKDLKSLKDIERQREHLFETIDEILDDRQKKRDELRKRFEN